MATFAKSTFNAASYASFRPTYPRSLFEFIYTYHAQSGRAGWETVVDLGCGTGMCNKIFLLFNQRQEAIVTCRPCRKGQATLEVADQFKEAVGCDPSEGMVKNARLAAEQSGRAQKPEFVVSPAEKLSFLGDSSADMAIAAQAAHWFDYKALFPELARVLKPGGTVALWNYAELRFGGRPTLDPLISEYSHSDESLGPHWQQPGRSILEGYLQKVPVPTCAPWDPTSIRRVYYVGDHEPSLQGEKLPIILRKHLTWDAFNSYLRTWSSLHDYLVKHPDDKDSEGRDIVDRFIREVYEKGEKLPGTNAKVWREGFVAEWPLVLLLLKKAHK